RDTPGSVANGHGRGNGAGRDIHQRHGVVAEVADRRDAEAGLTRLAATATTDFLPVAHVAVAAARAIGIDLARGGAAVTGRGVAVVTRFAGIEDAIAAHGSVDGRGRGGCCRAGRHRRGRGRRRGGGRCARRAGRRRRGRRARRSRGGGRGGRGRRGR